jgi:dipeptidyl aminopeptidase/acylaminoacyl peptidase
MNSDQSDPSVKNRGLKLALITLAAVAPTVVLGQQALPLRVQDLLDAREFGMFTPVEFSPDGKWIVYTARNNRNATAYDPSEFARAGVPSYAKGQEIWITNVDTGENRNLTGDKSANWSPAWSPDGRYIAFLSDRDGSGQAKLWLWEAATNGLRKVSDVSVRAWQIAWFENSREVVVTTLPENLSPDEYAKLVLPSGDVIRDKPEDRVEGSTVVLYKAKRESQDVGSATSSDPWSLEGSLSDLTLVNIENSREKRLVRGKRIGTYAVSPNGSHVAFTSPISFERPGSQQILWELSMVATQSHQMILLGTHIHFDYDGASWSWSPDSSHLAYLTGGPLEATTGAGDCYTIDLKGGPPQNVTRFDQQGPQNVPRRPLWNATGQSIYIIRGDSIWKTSHRENKAHELAKIPGHRVAELVAEGGNRIWSPDGGKFAVVLTLDEVGKQSGFYQVDLTGGQVTKLRESGQCNACVNTFEHVFGQPKGTGLVYFSQDSQHFDELWLTDSKFRSPRQLTHLNPQLDKYQMGATRLIEWRSLDGDTLHGALLLPVGYQEGKRYPLIVWVYGGASGSDDLNHFGLANSGALNLQLLATRGYAVLFPDSPQHLGTPMADLAKTVLPGVNKVIEMGVGDPERLGVMGQSNGGFSTLALIVQTKQFKAAVEIDGTADLVSLYSEMDKAGTSYGVGLLEHTQNSMGGTPWQYRERYIENSPFFYLDRVETPILIVHGTEDTTVASFLGDEVFVGLRRLGKEVEYAKYKGEGHSPIYWSYANQTDFCNRMIAWFDKYLKGSSSERGAAPQPTHNPH